MSGGVADPDFAGGTSAGFRYPLTVSLTLFHLNNYRLLLGTLHINSGFYSPFASFAYSAFSRRGNGPREVK